MTDPKAKTRWEKANISFLNYQEYLKSKNDFFKLNLIDLFYISNFKGGNSSINEPEKYVNEKLKFYSEALKEMNRLFGRKSLSELNYDETRQLIEQIQHTIQLTTKNKNSRIDGFQISYLSALLCSFFPNLIPIIDRRILYGIGLESRMKLNSQKQVVNMIELYPDLIEQVQILLKSDEETKSIRELDKELFIKKLP